MPVSVPSSPTGKKMITVVVVGLGMVGLRVLEKLKEWESENTDSEVTFSLVAFGEEPYHAYNRVGLTQYFEHKTSSRLLLQPEEWYKDNNVQVHVGDQVTKVDTTLKTVESASGVQVAYDFLVFATGSDAFVPPIKGVKQTGVFVYRTIDDVRKITEYSQGRSGAAVIGGGLLGLEAAKVCVDLGLKTYVVERNPYCLSRQIDAEGAKLLHSEVEKLGVRIYCNTSTDDITGEEGSVNGLQISDLTTKVGEKLDVELVIVATGIKARDDIAKASGLDCHPRGGIFVNEFMITSSPDVFAVGECANFDNMTYGLIAPGYDMAEIAATHLCRRAASISVPSGAEGPIFKGADMSTKLKLLGVHVASFGDYFKPESECTPLTYRDPFAGVYKRLLFSKDGKKLIGGILVGDTTSYTKLVALSKSKRPLQQVPSDLILPPSKNNGQPADNDLPDDAVVCSCNNVTKLHIIKALKEKGCSSVGEVRSCTKAGSGCGGCVPVVTDIVNAEMKKMGKKVQNFVCEHFAYSRKELFDICKILEIRTFPELLKSHGKGNDGCEICKPCAGSIFASLWNEHVMDAKLAPLQDTNDRFLANIQRGGTYSVVPRIPAGEITPEKLAKIAEVGKKYGLYTKITGGQRIDLFGAAREDLPQIWEELVNAGFESGHAYGKSLRTVKSCVGSTWCRYGRRDSVGFAVAIEQRYKGIRSPHKLKGGVSGCVRECAEAQGKDFGLIATEKGYNIYVCGNGGATPKHAVLLANDVPENLAIKYLDRFLMYYISTADRLQRTARWLEKLEPEGGIEFLKSVIVDDKLGIAVELERQIQALVDTYFCEWTEAIKNPERREQFKQFVNTKETQPTIEFISERGQSRPADWEADVPPNSEKKKSPPISEFPWTKPENKSSLRWVKVGTVSDFPVEGGVTVKIGDTQIAVFHYKSMNKWYATQNMCPHKRAFVLSGGIIGETTSNGVSVPKVSCPNHKKNFSLEDGKCISDDQYKIATFEVKLFPVEGGSDEVHLLLPPTKDLDDVLGTTKNMVRAKETMVKTNGVASSAKSIRFSEEATKPIVIDINGPGPMMDEPQSPTLWEGIKKVITKTRSITLPRVRSILDVSSDISLSDPKQVIAGEYSSEYAVQYTEHWDGIRKTSKKRIEKSDLMMPKEEEVVLMELDDGCGGPCTDKKLEW
ncbi:hypothetical protein HK098_000818 [Nowakowskiella sp. JEL0407]|nr:hypothetical protein HK098_000818 [Nowakowskiella sp. JEL0407]